MTRNAFNEEGNYDYRGNNEDKIGDKRCERVLFCSFFFSFLIILVLHYFVYYVEAGKQ